jgi:glycosyltransferase involved in cell wall biosynthesis
MRFTILIPTFDNGPVIINAIESVIAQDVSDWELFVVSDGAPKQTLELVDGYVDADPRIRCLRFDKGERHGEAWRHEVLKQATGDAVCYCCDDDFWFPDHLATMGDLLADSDFAHTRHVEIEPNFRVSGQTGGIGDDMLRERMLAEKVNFFSPTFASHRLDTYRRLPVGWSPAPEGIWTDLHMWRKWIAAPDMRFAASDQVSALHFPRPKRPDQSASDRMWEVDYWRSAFSDPHMREALRMLMNDARWPVDLSHVAAEALRRHEIEHTVDRRSLKRLAKNLAREVASRLVGR